ncbi:MAG: hypothetical protein IPG45_38245 [Deltaproteobacteria bacterium]|nr:hypothetical protein [Deltaproteobacteria bacterium]
MNRRWQAPGPGGPLLRALLALFGGALLAASFPPEPRPWSAIFGLVILVAITTDQGPAEGGALGLLFGVAWYHGVLWALVPEWGLGVGVAIAVACVLSLAAIFAVVGAVALLLPRWARPWSWALTWPGASWALERTIATPHQFASAFLERPEWVRSLGWWGLPLWDGLLLAVAGSVVVMVRHPGRRSWALAGGALAALALSAGAFGSGPPQQDGPLITGLQPGIPTARYELARWSLFARQQVEEVLDRGTTTALAEGAEVVVWPEGGNELSNRGLERRRQRLLAATGSVAATVLVGSREVELGGGIANALSVWRHGRFHEEIKKARPVPLAESQLLRGRPTVIDAAGARLGIGICFEAIFGDHLAALRQQGAEILVVSSDDASFGESPLSSWHLALARVRALEAGRSLAFFSNAGPSGIYDARGQTLAHLPLGSIGVVSARVPKVGEGGAPAPELGPALSLLGLFGLLLRRPWPKASPRSWAWSYGAAAVALLVWGASAAPLLGRGPPLDALSPLFRQTRQESCGPAALAFALTFLGDDVTEAELLNPSGSDWTSLADLAARARARGFVAEGRLSSMKELEQLGGAVAIAHYHAGHFVVVLSVSDEQVWLFDPAYGQTLAVPRADFEAVYSGRTLTLAPGQA